MVCSSCGGCPPFLFVVCRAQRGCPRLRVRSSLQPGDDARPRELFFMGHLIKCYSFMASRGSHSHGWHLFECINQVKKCFNLKNDLSLGVKGVSPMLFFCKSRGVCSYAWKYFVRLGNRRLTTLLCRVIVMNLCCLVFLPTVRSLWHGFTLFLAQCKVLRFVFPPFFSGVSVAHAARKNGLVGGEVGHGAP